MRMISATIFLNTWLLAQSPLIFQVFQQRPIANTAQENHFYMPQMQREGANPPASDEDSAPLVIKYNMLVMIIQFSLAALQSNKTEKYKLDLGMIQVAVQIRCSVVSIS